jgi:hypothetical protein
LPGRSRPPWKPRINFAARGNEKKPAATPAFLLGESGSIH